MEKGIKVYFLILSFFSAISVAGNPPYPVKIYKGFYLQTLLSQPVEIKSIDDVSRAISENWYASIDVNGGGKTTNKTLKSCNDYFKASIHALQPVKEFERSAYYEFAIMCEAAKFIASAETASISYLNDFILNKSALKKLPKALSFVVSSVEYKRIVNNKKFQSWHDVDLISSVIDIKEASAVFKSKGAQQQVSMVAKADFNRDGIEDLLITSKDSVVGGSYTSIRLFMLTQTDAKSHIILLNMY